MEVELLQYLKSALNNALIYYYFKFVKYENI